MMKFSMIKFKSMLVNTPLPSSLSYMWNFGSLLGASMLLQIGSGMLLSYHYVASLEGAFLSVLEISDEVWWGWMVRSVHSNGASMIFLLAYLHVGRGLYYASYRKKSVWVTGCLILILLMAAAFTGYVLPWGQMSYWGVTVITNLLSSLPLGDKLVQWVWGGFSVSGPTLTRFFAFHYILPFIVLGVGLIHILALHNLGSSNPLGVSSNSDKISFHPYYVVKDLMGVVVMTVSLIIISLAYSDIFMDSDNWVPANPLLTPPHIQPEWYFLFAYTILRSIPSKLGGVLALGMSVGVLALLPLLQGKSCRFTTMKKMVYWLFVVDFMSLTFLGSVSPDEAWLVGLCQLLSLGYFVMLIMMGLL